MGSTQMGDREGPCLVAPNKRCALDNLLHGPYYPCYKHECSVHWESGGSSYSRNDDKFSNSLDVVCQSLDPQNKGMFVQ